MNLLDLLMFVMGQQYGTHPPQIDPSMYDTQLNPKEEEDFLRWKMKHAPRDSGFDYDFRGAFKAGVTPDKKTGHWPDTFKKPNHPTFSDQSIYYQARPDIAGSWFSDLLGRDVFLPPGGRK